MGGQPASFVFPTNEGQGGGSKEAGFSSQTSTQNLDFQEYNQTAEDKGDFESSVSTLEEEVTSNEWAYRVNLDLVDLHL
jgi:hypothetical protein